jgi:hypothetical protein
VVARSLASRLAAYFVKASGRAGTPAKVGNTSGSIHDWQEVRRKVWKMKQAPQSSRARPNARFTSASSGLCRSPARRGCRCRMMAYKAPEGSLLPLPRQRPSGRLLP